MRQSSILLATFALALPAFAGAAAAKDAVVGVNVCDEGAITQPQQDAEIDRLAGYGVKTIRTGFSDKSAHFITQAYGHGIGTIGIVYPSGGAP